MAASTRPRGWRSAVMSRATRAVAATTAAPVSPTGTWGSTGVPYARRNAPVRMVGVSEKPGRYQRSSNGLIGALIVTLLAIGAFVLVRSLTRADVDVEREPVDYAAAATAARGRGFDVIAPTSLPDGWIATAVDLQQTDPPLWGLGLLTDDDKFVGLRQEDASVDDLVEDNIDEDADEGDPLVARQRARLRVADLDRRGRRHRLLDRVRRPDGARLRLRARRGAAGLHRPAVALRPHSSSAMWPKRRTSCGHPQATAILPAHILAASSSSRSRTANPPRNSLVSTKGPSVITTLPEVASAL